MSLGRSLIKTPATLIRRKADGEDGHGNPTYALEEVEVLCELQQRRSTEDFAAVDDLSDAIWDLYLPVGTELNSGDSIDVNDFTYELVGEPWSTRTHVEATVRRTAGPADDEGS